MTFNTGLARKKKHTFCLVYKWIHKLKVLFTNCWIINTSDNKGEHRIKNGGKTKLSQI